MSVAAVFCLVLLGPQLEQLGSDDMTLVPTGTTRLGYEIYEDVLTGDRYPVDEDTPVEYWQRQMGRIQAGDVLLTSMTHVIYADENLYMFGYSEVLPDGSQRSSSNRRDPPLASDISLQHRIDLWPHLKALIPRIFDPDDGEFLYVKNWYLEGTILPVEYREYAIAGFGRVIVGQGDSIDAPPDDD